MVRKNGEEEEWSEVKGEIDAIFDVAEWEYPRQKRFVVVVKKGDRTNLGREGRADDDDV